MVQWDLMIGPGEALLLNYLPLWGLSEVLLDRRRGKLGRNDDNYLRWRRHYGRRSSRWKKWWRLKMLPLLRFMQTLWRQ